MAWDNAVVTNAGVALLKDVLAGGVLTLDDAAGGTGTVPTASLMAQTALKEQKQQFTIVSSMNVTNGKKIKIQITNLGLSTGYTLLQIGIWAHVDSGASVLFAILQDDSGIAVPAESELADFVLSFYAVVNFSNEAAFTVTVDSSALVSMSTLNEALRGKADLGDDGKIPESQLPEMDYIPTIEKGAANGVAELDNAGKVPESQLPEMNYDEKGSAVAALTAANQYTDTSALQTLAEAKAYADAATPAFIYKCTGDADSTAIANIVNDFFNNGTAMSMKLIVTGTMGIAFTNTYYAMYINATNSRGARVYLDFSDCYIPELTTSNRDLLYVDGGVALNVFGLDVTATRYGLYLAGTSNNIFIDCKITAIAGIYCVGYGNSMFINCAVNGTGFYGAYFTNAFSGAANFVGGKIVGSASGVRSDTANTSSVIKLTDCEIKGGTYAVQQYGAPSTTHWFIKGCSFNTDSIYVNGAAVSVSTTVANAYLAIQAYHNLFSQTIE